MAKKISRKAELLPLKVLNEAAECLKCIAHPQRLRIIDLLLSDEYTVGEIAEKCSIPQPSMSEHLRLMSNKGFLKKERRGRYMYYQIKEEQLENILECVRKKYLKEK